MDLYELIEEVNSKVDSFVDMMEDVSPDVIGLDRRCARKLHISEDAIVVSKLNDRNLQYYGGFEYVDSEYRTELMNTDVIMAVPFWQAKYGKVFTSISEDYAPYTPIAFDNL